MIPERFMAEAAVAARKQMGLVQLLGCRAQFAAWITVAVGRCVGLEPGTVVIAVAEAAATARAEHSTPLVQA